MNLLNEKPIYGKDLRESVHVPQVFDTDLFTTQRSFNKNQNSIPSAVFNYFAKDENINRYTETDWDDAFGIS